MPIECPFVNADALLRYIAKHENTPIDADNPKTSMLLKELLDNKYIEHTSPAAFCIDIETYTIEDAKRVAEESPNTYRLTPKGHQRLRELEEAAEKELRQSLESDNAAKNKTVTTLKSLIPFLNQLLTFCQTVWAFLKWLFLH